MLAYQYIHKGNTALNHATSDQYDMTIFKTEVIYLVSNLQYVKCLLRLAILKVNTELIYTCLGVTGGTFCY